MFRRRSTAAVDGTDQPTTDPAGKGRPTPKRRDAQQLRRTRMAPPRDRREAARRQRERSRQERLAGRQALVSGDERFLPARDRGPVRRFCRDFVDSRRSIAEMMLPIMVVSLVLTFLPWPQAQAAGLLVLYLLVGLLIVELVFLAVRLRRELRQRFPAESHRGATAYALMRTTQLRRTRLPKPRVKPGQRP